MKEEIHIGKRIQEKMKEERRSVSWLAKELSCTKANVYKIYDKSDIDIVRLFQVSRALNYDFFKDLSAMYNRNSGIKPG